MSQNRAQVDGGANNVRHQVAGDSILSQLQYSTLATAGDGAWGATAVMAGVINRTGPGANYADTIASAASLIAAAPVLSVGDSFTLLVRNTVTFANTVAAGSGIVLGSNTAIAASLVREYLFTVLSSGVETIMQAGTVNGSAVLTGLTSAQAEKLMPGMGVTGTGIPGSTTVIGVNGTTGAVTLSANASATGTVGLTFFPRIRVDGVRTSTL